MKRDETTCNELQRDATKTSSPRCGRFEAASLFGFGQNRLHGWFELDCQTAGIAMLPCHVIGRKHDDPVLAKELGRGGWCLRREDRSVRISLQGALYLEPQ